MNSTCERRWKLLEGSLAGRRPVAVLIDEIEARCRGWLSADQNRRAAQPDDHPARSRKGPHASRVNGVVADTRGPTALHSRCMARTTGRSVSDGAIRRLSQRRSRPC
jgi:hypothetical protein